MGATSLRLSTTMRHIRRIFYAVIGFLCTKLEDTTFTNFAAPRRRQRWIYLGFIRYNKSTDEERPIADRFWSFGPLSREKPWFWFTLGGFCGNCLWPALSITYSQWRKCRKHPDRRGTRDWITIVWRWSYRTETTFHIHRVGPWGLFLRPSWNCEWLAVRFGQRNEQDFGDVYTLKSRWLGYHYSI